MFEAKPYQPPPVDSDEMSFAIALFVAAARGRIVLPNRAGSTLQESHPLSNDPLLVGAKAVLPDGWAWLPDEAPLACAVSVLLHHYEHDVRQQAMCSRLVAFHILMARRRGGHLDLGTQESEAYLIEAALSPAIVKAAAKAPVGDDGLFDEAEFESLVESFSIRDELSAVLRRPKRPYRHSAARLTVTEEVQQLSLQIFAFQSCVASDPTRSTPRFQTLEQLCARVTNTSGDATLQAMLSRAWSVALPDFPWLQSTSPSNARLLMSLGSVHPAPTHRDAMMCEITILGLLIELLRSLLGDAVTVQLLRSLWPLADLRGESGAASQSMDVPTHWGSRAAGSMQ